MQALDANQLPVGFVRVNRKGFLLEANSVFRSWAECASPEGRPLSDFMVPAEDFLEGGHNPGMMARPDRPERAAFVLTGDDEISFTVIDASERYAAGRALRAARVMADRTQKRLQLVIDSSISFANADTEQSLAEILASTAAQAYQSEEAAVYLADGAGTLHKVAGESSISDVLNATPFLLGSFEMPGVLKISGAEEAAALSPRLDQVMQATGVQSIIAAPLHLEAEVLGLFVCLFHHPRQFDDEATPLAEALAGQAAQTLNNLRLRSQLHHAATHDETTGLPNRRKLEVGNHAIHNLRNTAVLFIDLDGFKAVNDICGHLQGDHVLRQVAARLRSTVREDDLVIRYGGDEFVVICEITSELAVNDLADRVCGALQHPYDELPADVRISASVGVSTGRTSSDPPSIEKLIRRADQAMYKAKISGGNQVVAT